MRNREECGDLSQKNNCSIICVGAFGNACDCDSGMHSWGIP